jgi:hypothetical protein
MRTVGYQMPRQYELVLKDLDNANKGYMQSTKYGTEPELTEPLGILEACRITRCRLANQRQRGTQ